MEKSFFCQYTTRKLQKAKNWLEGKCTFFKNGKITIFDDSDSVVTTEFNRKAISGVIDGTQLSFELDACLVEIGDEIAPIEKSEEQEFSGKIRNTLSSLAPLSRIKNKESSLSIPTYLNTKNSQESHFESTKKAPIQRENYVNIKQGFSEFCYDKEHLSSFSQEHCKIDTEGGQSCFQNSLLFPISSPNSCAKAISTSMNYASFITNSSSQICVSDTTPQTVSAILPFVFPSVGIPLHSSLLPVSPTIFSLPHDDVSSLKHECDEWANELTSACISKNEKDQKGQIHKRMDYLSKEKQLKENQDNDFHIFSKLDSIQI